MIRTFSPSIRRSALALLAVLAGTSCDKTDTLSAPSETPAAVANGDSIAASDSTAAGDADTLALTDSLATAYATASYSGLPYGPIGLWAGTDFEWGPGPF